MDMRFGVKIMLSLGQEMETNSEGLNGRNPAVFYTRRFCKTESRDRTCGQTIYHRGWVSDINGLGQACNLCINLPPKLYYLASPADVVILLVV